MNMVEAIRAHLAVPAEFGASMFYLHYALVAEDRLSGEEVTLNATEEGDGQVHLAHTEWRDVDGRRESQVLASAIVDWANGGLRYVEGDEAAVKAALAQTARMSRVA